MARAVFGRSPPGRAPVFLLDVASPAAADTVKRLLARVLCCPATPAPSAGDSGISSSLAGGTRQSAASTGALTTASTGRPERFNILVCGGLVGPSFAPVMVENDAGGRAALDAMRWLSAALAPPPPPPRPGSSEAAAAAAAAAAVAAAGSSPGGGSGRLRWTDLLELVGTAGAGCDGIHILADSAPGQSADRLLDEIHNLEREQAAAAAAAVAAADGVGRTCSGWRGVVHGVPIDAPPECARVLRRVAAETGGRFALTEGFLVRERLIYESIATSGGGGWEGPYAEAERAAGCAPATAADPPRARCGRMDGAPLAVPPPRRVALVWRGEAEAPAGAGGADGTDGYARGLRVVAFSGEWVPTLDRTFDTWGR